MKPLEGVRVVEFATSVAVPAAARIMADMGAEVVKIERVGGDPWRHYYYGAPQETFHTVMNAGKRMISINTKIPEGKEALLRLLAKADVFCSSIRPQSLKRMGLDYDSLHALYPRLVYCDFTAYGAEGSEAGLPGYDSTAYWAASGLLRDLAYDEEKPCTPPLAIGDTASSGSVYGAILTALYMREKTGEGQYVTTSLYANGIWNNHAAVVACQDGFDEKKFPRTRVGRIPVIDNHICGDGKYLLLSVSYYRGDYPKFMEAMGLGELLKDERFCDWASVLKNRDALRVFIEERFLTDTAENWSKKLSDADIVNHVMNTANDISKSEQAWVNGYLEKVSFPTGVEAVLPKPPFHFPRLPEPVTTPSRALGEDTSAVLRELGYSEDEIRKMLESGAVSGK